MSYVVHVDVRAAVASTIWFAMSRVIGVILCILFVLVLVWAIVGAGSWAVVAVGLALGVISPIAFQAIGYLIRLSAARWMH